MTKKEKKLYARLEREKNLTSKEIYALEPILMCLKKKSRSKIYKIIAEDLGYFAELVSMDRSCLLQEAECDKKAFATL